MTPISGHKLERNRMRIIFATNNQDKMKEIHAIMADFPIEILSLKEAGIHADVEENGKTFEENAVIKAEAICKLTGCVTIADDSGLEIDALGGEPGIYSARYMGEDTSGVPDEERSARFVCAVAAAFPDAPTQTVRGTIEGRIGYEEAGENGFGYDPIFYLPEYGCTTAQMAPEDKNKISHRGRALEKIRPFLKDYFSA